MESITSRTQKMARVQSWENYENNVQVVLNPANKLTYSFEEVYEKPKLVLKRNFDDSPNPKPQILENPLKRIKESSGIPLINLPGKSKEGKPKQFDISNVLKLSYGQNRVFMTKSVEFTTEIYVKATSTKRLCSSELSRYRTQVKLLLTHWPAFLEAIDVMSKFLIRLNQENATIFDAMETEQIKRFKLCLKVFERINQSLVFDQSFSVLQNELPTMGDFQITRAKDSGFQLSVTPLLKTLEEYSSIISTDAETIATQGKPNRMANYRDKAKMTILTFNDSAVEKMPLILNHFETSRSTKLIDVFRRQKQIEITHMSDHYTLFAPETAFGKLCTKENLEIGTDLVIKTSPLLEKTSSARFSPVSMRLKTVYTVCCFLLRQGCMLPSDAKNALLHVWKDPDAADLIKLAFHYFDLHRKNFMFENRTNQLVSSDKIHGKMICFQDSMRVWNNDSIQIYFEPSVLEIVKMGNYDMLFVDGTHVKGKKNLQMLVFRMYDSISMRIINAAYALCASHETATYELILGKLKAVGFFEKVKFSMTDFERSLRNAIQNVIKNCVLLSCFFHLVTAARKYAAKINKTIVALKFTSESKPTTVKIHMFLGYALFLGENKLIGVITLLYELIMNRQFSIADHLFISYFIKTYTVLYKIQKADLSVYPFLTNNTVEGTNSGIKRAFFGKNTEAAAENWILHDTKRSILNYETKKVYTVPQITLEITKAETDNIWLRKFIVKLEETAPSRLSRKEEFDKMLNILRSIDNFCIKPTKIEYHRNGVLHRHSFVDIDKVKAHDEKIYDIIKKRIS